MNNNKRQFWQFPWQYKESIVVTLGIIIVGFLLQITLGNFNFFLLHFPINLIFGGLIILLIVILSFRKQNPILQWLSSVPLSVCLIGGLVGMGIIMGLIPQVAKINPHAHVHWEHARWAEVADLTFLKLGLKQVTNSWQFVLLYSFTLFVLGYVIARRLHTFRKKDYGFYLNHFGLWIFLFASGIGAADMKRYVMYVEEGKQEWRVYDSEGAVMGLPIAITLNDFIMEEYPPKLVVIDSYTGDAQPDNRPYYFQIDEKYPSTKILDWDITIDEYIHEAVRKTDTSFQHIPMPGSMPAVKVTVHNKKKDIEKTRWVTCGSMDQYFIPLELDANFSLVMTKPEPKRFASDITVVTEKNPEDIHYILEVNKPLKTGNWMIYQYGYDNAAGKASRYSHFELVYDPWIETVYLGLILMALGSICMLWLGNKKNKEL